MIHPVCYWCVSGLLHTNTKGIALPLFSVLLATDTLEMASLDDRSVLLELFRATNGPSWERNDGWGTSENISTWYGVKMDDEGRVVKLELPGNNLKGEASRTRHTAVGDMANGNSLHYVSEWVVLVAIVHGLP